MSWPRLTAVGATLAAALLVAAPAVAQQPTVPVDALLERPETFDGRASGVEITVEGELVGDYGFRRDGSVWTQLNDDSYARDPVVDGGRLTGANVGIAVRIAADEVRELDPPGGYRRRGPLVRLTGVWRHHDPDRSGESYLAVSRVVLVEPGKRIAEGGNWSVSIVGITLVGSALAVRRRARSRHGVA